MRDEDEAEGGGDPSLSSLNRDLLLDEEFHDFDVFFEDQFMPTWRPLTPPLSDLDEELYSNELSNIFYEDYLMDEIDLPSAIQDLPRPLNKYTNSPMKKPKEAHSAVLKILNAASPHVQAEALAAEAALKSAALSQPSVSGLSIGMPSPAPIESPSVRRSTSSNRKTMRSIYESLPGRAAKGDMRRPTTPPPAEREAKDYEGPEWTILEDYALLQAVLSEQRLTHMSPNEKSGIKLNWEYISGFVNRVTANYRSPRQCSVHYQMAVLPREDGRILTIDPLTKKPRKLSLSAAELSHLRKGRTNTHQQYQNDVESVLRDKLVDRWRAVKRMSEKRLPPFVRFNPKEIPSTGSPPPNHKSKLELWGMTNPPPVEAVLAAREEKRTAMMAQEKELRVAQEAKAAEDRERAALAASISSIIVRPSALPHQSGQPLVAPPLITLDVPPPPRMHPPIQPSIQMNTGGGQGLPPGGPLPIPQPQPLPPSSAANPLLQHPQPHPMAEHMPMGGMARRVGTPIGVPGGGGMMGSGVPSGGGGPSQYVVVGGDGGPQGSQTPTGAGGGGQSQQVAGASRMGGMMGREGGSGQGAPGMSTGGQPQMYRALSGTGPQKRPAQGTVPRPMGATYVESVPIQRGASVGGRPQYNPRLAQRVMPGGQPNRVYMTTGGGTGSGSASPSQGGQMGGEGAMQGQTGRQYLQQPHTVRVGIQPPRMGVPMGGNGGGGGPPKRAQSIVSTKQGPMMVSRAGAGIGQMRGAQQANRFPHGGATGQNRMMVVRGEGAMRPGIAVAGGGQGMGGVPSSIQSRPIPSNRPMNPRPHLPAPTLNLPNLDSPSSSMNMPSPSLPQSEPLPPSQGGPLPPISLSSSSSSYPNPSSHHSM